jgi:hypothetical protein
LSTTASAHDEQVGGSRRSESMRRAMAVAVGPDGGFGSMATPKLRNLICPFCGDLTADSGRCSHCHARFDPLSRQATQNEMGPWFIRDDSIPYRPGCSYSTIHRLIESGGIQANSVLRGPSTHQFWMLAKHTPGVAHLLGVCHSCGESVETDAFACKKCHAPFSTDRDRQHLGLGPTRPLPGRAPAQVLALHAEPPAGADSVAGPATIPHAPESRGSERRIEERRQHNSGGNGSQELDSLERIDELSRAVGSLRRAWLQERKRSWISLVCAGAITVLALVIILLS